MFVYRGMWLLDTSREQRGGTLENSGEMIGWELRELRLRVTKIKKIKKIKEITKVHR